MYSASVEKDLTGSHVVMAADAATVKTSGFGDASGVDVQPAEPKARIIVAAEAKAARTGCRNEGANRDSLKKWGKV